MIYGVLLIVLFKFVKILPIFELDLIECTKIKFKKVCNKNFIQFARKTGYLGDF